LNKVRNNTISVTSKILLLRSKQIKIDVKCILIQLLQSELTALCKSWRPSKQALSNPTSIITKPNNKQFKTAITAKIASFMLTIKKASVTIKTTVIKIADYKVKGLVTGVYLRVKRVTSW